MNRALRETSHRPWPMPPRPWIMAQTWHDLLFAHWPVDAREMRERVPKELELDLFDGAAWLGLVPFRMSGVRLRGTPPIPGFHAFPELNLRTYVKHAGKSGVWFFALEATNPIAVEVARRWFHLPYFHARMSCKRDGESIEYASERTDRRGSPARLRARYEPTGPVALALPGTFEHWSTERYCLFAEDDRGRVLRGDIQHAPWLLQPARCEIETSTLPRAHGFFEATRAPHLLFARRQDVVAWAPRVS